MCYIIAKKHTQPGCFAFKMERGKRLAELVTYLGGKTLNKNIQILTVSDMDAFGEYKPYNIIPSEIEFISKVLKM